MNQLSLHQQIIQLSNSVAERVSRLKSSDPRQDWFQWELDQLSINGLNNELQFDEANARLSALKQLMHLVYEHCVRMQNPGYADPVSTIPDSMLTVQARLPANVLKSARELQFCIDPDLLHNRYRENEQHDPVSPTAKIVGYLRGLDHSQVIKQSVLPLAEGKILLEGLGITEPETHAAMSVLFQSRYHAINAAIGKVGQDVSQIIELAAGISPRGFQWSRMSPGTIYVESDLPQLMIRKAKLIRNFLLTQTDRGKGMLHCCAVDVLDRSSLLRSLDSIDRDQPFTVVSEGLLLYFGKEEMRKFFSNIHELLHQYPMSAWVTDLVTKQDLKNLLDSHQGVAEGVKKTFALTGRSVIPDNPFQGEPCIHEWLNEFDLRAESEVRLSQMTPRLQFDVPVHQQIRDQIVGSRKIWRINAEPH